jgi:hypothetical protein
MAFRSRPWDDTSEWFLHPQFGEDFDAYRRAQHDQVRRQRQQYTGQYAPWEPLQAFTQHILAQDFPATSRMQRQGPGSGTSPFTFPQMQTGNLTAQQFADQQRDFRTYLANMNFAWDEDGNPTGVDIGGYGSAGALLGANAERLRPYLPSQYQFRPGGSQFGNFGALQKTPAEMQMEQRRQDRMRVDRRGPDDDVIQHARPVVGTPR